MQVKPDQYIFPPRANQCIPRNETQFLADYNYLAQLKYNDSRCIIKYCEDGQVELWNRHAEKFRSYTPTEELNQELQELRQILGLRKDSVSMLDGGLLDQKHQAIKNTIVIWDILVRNGEQLLGTKYKDRYDSLYQHATKEPWYYKGPIIPGSKDPRPQPNLGEGVHHHEPINFGKTYTPSIFIPDNWEPKDWDKAWELVHKANAPFTLGKPNSKDYEIKPVLEGLVYKDPNGILEMGYREKNNESWMVRSRVTTGRHQF